MPLQYFSDKANLTLPSREKSNYPDLTSAISSNPPWLPLLGFGAGTGALPLRKIIVRDDY
jgi:hypothetical protein